MIQQEHCTYRTSNDTCGRFRNPIKCGVPICWMAKRDKELILKYKETMEREQAKKWAELFAAYGEGKTIQIKHYIHFSKFGDVWEWEDIDGDGIDSQRCLSDYRIKPEPKTRRMTAKELSDWLRDEPQEHREYKYRSGTTILHSYAYDENDETMPCQDILIRKNHGKWEEPIIEVEE